MGERGEEAGEAGLRSPDPRTKHTGGGGGTTTIGPL